MADDTGAGLLTNVEVLHIVKQKREMVAKSQREAPGIFLQDREFVEKKVVSS